MGETCVCSVCHQKFDSRPACRSHKRAAHEATFQCQSCSKSFYTEQALKNHHQSLPKHAATFRCSPCKKNYKSEQALRDHQRDSPKHSGNLNCGTCGRSFQSEQAVRQHERDSHTRPIVSGRADSAYVSGTVQDLQQDQQNRLRSWSSSAHENPTAVSSEAEDPSGDKTVASWSMYPELHHEVSQFLEESNVFVQFSDLDDSETAIRDYDTNVMGSFNCENTMCKVPGWGSKKVPITIRMYTGSQYNARVYHQRCRGCDHPSRPRLDDSYAERVSYRLKKWKGIYQTPPEYRQGRRIPHRRSLCEGCRYGHCSEEDFSE